jgi:hypothetical protein
MLPAKNGNFGRYGRPENLSVRFFPFRELTPATSQYLLKGILRSVAP